MEPREPVHLPLQLDNGVSASTRDISASGLFFETDSEQRVGNLIDFVIDLNSPGGPLKFKVQGQIVRIAPQGSRTGVGVKVLSNRLEAVE